MPLSRLQALMAAVYVASSGRLTNAWRAPTEPSLTSSSSMVLEFEAGAEWEKCSIYGGSDSMPIAWHHRQTNTSYLMSASHSNMVAGTGPSLDQIVGRTKGPVFQSFCDTSHCHSGTPETYANNQWLQSVRVFANGTVVGLAHNEFKGEFAPLGKYCSRHSNAGPLKGCELWSTGLVKSTDGGKKFELVAKPPHHLIAAPRHKYSFDEPISGFGAISPMLRGADGAFYGSINVKCEGGFTNNTNSSCHTQGWGEGNCIFRATDLTNPESFRGRDHAANFTIQWHSAYDSGAHDNRDCATIPVTPEGSFGSHVCFRKIVPLHAQAADSSAMLDQPTYIALGDTVGSSGSVKYSFSYDSDFGGSFRDVNTSWTAPQFLELGGAERWLASSSATSTRAGSLNYHYPALFDVRSPELGMAGGTVESQDDGDSYSLVSYPGPPVPAPVHATAVTVEGAGCTTCNGVYSMATPPPGFHVSPFFKLDATHVVYRRSDGEWHLANLGVKVWYASSATGSAGGAPTTGWYAVNGAQPAPQSVTNRKSHSNETAPGSGLYLYLRGPAGFIRRKVALRKIESPKHRRKVMFKNTWEPEPLRDGASGAVCTSGGTIAHSNRSRAAAACVGTIGDECSFSCNTGFLAIGRHVCQTYSQGSQTFLNNTFFGGRCERLCAATSRPCPAGLVPTRVNSTDTDGPCLHTTCSTADDALLALARGNYALWQLARNNRTGIYIAGVDLTLPPAMQPFGQGATGETGLGLTFECVAEALHFQTRSEAQEKVLLTLRSLTGLTSGFRLPRNRRGFSPTFVDSSTGAVWQNQTGTQGFALMSTDLMAAGILFAKTYFERTDPGSTKTIEISKLASQLFSIVQWETLLCGQNGKLDPNGTNIPMLVDWADGCSALMPVDQDGYYQFNEEFLAVWFAWQTACGSQPKGQCKNKGIERMWQRWQGRRKHTVKSYNGHPLLSLWSAYVVHLPFYMSHAFNSDADYTRLFASHWAAEWSFYNSSDFYAGDQGRYGLGAGPVIPSCAGGRGYAADLFLDSGPVCPACHTGDHCRIFSPSSVVGYLPANPGVIRPQILALLATGETVYQLPAGDSQSPSAGDLSAATTPDIVLWRKSLLFPGWSADPPETYVGVTTVDVSSELFGLSTLWLGADFYRNNTNHWPNRQQQS